MTAAPVLLEVEGLSVSYRQGAGWTRVVDDVSLAIATGEALGLVGESGCGKSTVALQLLGYRHPSMRADGGAVRFRGSDLLTLSRPELDRLRGDRISFVPQNPTTALNPGIRVGDQIAEVLIAHGRAGGGRTAGLFDRVGLPTSEEFMRRYPHQLSGGQQQRVCVAMALACDPDLVVLDEPTTGLDVTTQAQIIALLVRLRADIGMSMLYVTHDLGVLSEIADRVGVMYAGRVVETAPTKILFAEPKHPYTRGLIGSIPRVEADDGRPARPLRGLLRREAVPPGCPFAPRCDFAVAGCAENRQSFEPVGPGHEVACWRWRDIAPAAEDTRSETPRSVRPAATLLGLDGVSLVYAGRSGGFTAARDITFSIADGETFALVGESGSGKSTIARAVSGLLAPRAGTIRLSGHSLAGRVADRTAEQRRLIQYVFQNPDASLNPRARVGTIIARPIEMFFRLSATEVDERVMEVLDAVRLDRRYAERFPDQLSGGERQRVAIARALVADPALLLCDEVLSALDVSVQANMLELLQRLKAERGIAMLFISHDLAVVRMIADRIGVLYRGEMLEIGTRDQVFARPFHPYTHSLLMAVPSPWTRRRYQPLRRASQAPAETGCVFAGRCPWQAGAICESERPPWQRTAEGLAIRCHLSLDELAARAEWAATPEPQRTAERISG